MKFTSTNQPFSKAKTRLGYVDMPKDKESNLGDHGVRKYDSEVGRFLAVDPLWEKYHTLNPFQYSANSPVMLLDKNGMLVDPYYGYISSAFNSIESEIGNLGNNAKESFNNIKSDIYNQYEIRKNEARWFFTPDAVSTSISGQFTFGMGGGVTKEYLHLFQGPLKGQEYETLSGDGYLGANANIGISNRSYKFFGDINKFDKSFLKEAQSYNLSFERGNFGFSFNVMMKDGNYLIGYDIPYLSYSQNVLSNMGLKLGYGLSVGTSNNGSIKRVK